MMGGFGAHEYMAPCAAGENEVALSARLRRERRGGERRGRSRSRGCPAPLDAPEEVAHARARRRSSRSRTSLGVPAGALIKAFPVVAEARGLGARGRARRPPHQRDQAPQRARRRLPAGAAGGGRASASAPPGLHRPGRRDGAGCSPTRRCAPRRLRGGRQRARRPPARRRAGPRLRAHVRRRAHACEAGDTRRTAPDPRSSPPSRSATSSSSARATPSRSAPRYLDEDGRASSSIWMGSYGIGPARDGRRGGRAGGRRARHRRGRVRSRRSTWSSSTLGKEGRGGADVADAPLRRAARGRARRALRRPRRRAPARSSPTPSCSAARCASRSGKRSVEAGELEVQVRRGREKRSVSAGGGRRGGGRAVARRSPDHAPAARARPLRRPAARDASRAAAQPVDDPERDRLRAARADPGLPRGRARARTTAHDTLACVLFAVIGWSDYADGMAARITGPVQPPRRAAGPAHRPPAGVWPARWWPGTSSCCRAGRSPSWPCARRSCWCSPGSRFRRGVDLEINMLGRWAVWPVMSRPRALPADGGLGHRRRPALPGARARPWRRPSQYVAGRLAQARGDAIHPQAQLENRAILARALADPRHT